MVNDFWQRIKHGNVAKVAAAYAALSWILLQAQEAVLLPLVRQSGFNKPSFTFGWISSCLPNSVGL